MAEREALPSCGLQTKGGFKMGCGEPIRSVAELYRCATCDVAFHKTCLVAHFNWRDDLLPIPSHIERLALAEREADRLRTAIQAHIDMEPPATASPYWSKPEGDLRAAVSRSESSPAALALNADGPEEAEADPKISHNPTQRAEATTTPEGAKGWVDQAGSAQVLAGGHGLDVAPDASPGGSERRPASEQDGGGKPSSAPNAALNADGEAT